MKMKPYELVEKIREDVTGLGGTQTLGKSENVTA